MDKDTENIKNKEYITIVDNDSKEATEEEGFASFVGKNLEYARCHYPYGTGKGKLTLKAVGEELNIHLSQIKHIESGDRIASLKVFKLLCDLYHVDPAEMLGMDTSDNIGSRLGLNLKGKKSSTKPKKPSKSTDKHLGSLGLAIST